MVIKRVILKKNKEMLTLNGVWRNEALSKIKQISPFLCSSFVIQMVLIHVKAFNNKNIEH